MPAVLSDSVGRMSTPQRTSQYVQQAWETPSHAEIPVITKHHIAALESTDSDEAWVLAGMHHVVIHTIGRKSGTEHKIALPTWNDPSGVRVVVASFAGSPGHPAWYLNLRDSKAGEVLCRAQKYQYWSTPDLLEDGPEHQRIWDLLVADREWYTDYQARTGRTIPLVRLPETRRV